MKIDANDPRWTAYALGELRDDKERAELESVLQESAEMSQLVEEIRQTAAMLTDEMKNESPVVLTQAQRSRVESQANRGKSWFIASPVWAMAGATAVLVLIVSVSIYQVRQRKAISPQYEPLIAAVQNAPAPAPEPAKPESIDKSAATAHRQIVADLAKLKAGIAPAANQAPAAIQVPPEKSGALLPAYEAELGRASATPATLPAPPTDESPVIGVSNMVGSIPGGVAQGFAGGVPGGVAAGKVKYELMASPPPGPVRRGAETEAAPAHWPRRRWPSPPIPFPIPSPGGNFNTEAYDYVADNPFLEAAQNPLSTFSIDVDTASYSNMRRFLDGGSLPPKDAIRIEELINYFDYSYKGPANGKPFAAHFELAEAPWKADHKLLRIGLKAQEIEPAKRPPTSLVFLIDVSGSMADANKLPLVQDSMRLLVNQLTEGDRVAIVTYSSDARLALPSTSGDQKEKLRTAIDYLRAGGSTNGASGIQLAYETAQNSFLKGGTNRVILATDGDFNVGITNRGDLSRLIEEKAKSGIYLSALGFGMGNYKDATLEMLAKNGHGNYAYIDTLEEAKKVLVQQINATLVSVAKDVKIQIEFNPKRVSSYRLIGYEDRVMPKEDFNDDTKDAGVIGAGHAVTALYEIVPAGKPAPSPAVDPLKYQKQGQSTAAAASDEMATVKIRYKEPEKDSSQLLEFGVKDPAGKFSEASQDFKFAAAVAAFGMVLRDSPHKGNANMDRVLDWAKEGKGADGNGYRQEFIRLIHRAYSIAK
jgi:Ca-activated chloride channel homolog